MKAAEGGGQPGLRRNSRDRLDRLLDAMIDRPDEQAALAAEVEQDFSETRAVMVLDMSGFSRTVRQRGITAFLLMIHQMKRIARPAVEGAGGIVVKAEADNLFCLFGSVAAAVDASRDIVERLEAANVLLSEDRRLYASIGIGWGPVLNVDEEDLFGDEVNLASKLGEDIAERGEILLTEAARAEADAEGVATRPRTVSVSGLSFTCHRLG